METNKEILQSHNTIINDNNIIIDELLELVNEIPEAVDPVLQSKTVSPSTSSQTVTPDENYDGLSKVTVSAVSSSIDSNIKASNIKQGVSILGINGTLQEYVAPSLQSKTVSPSTSSQTITPDNNYDGLGQVIVSAVSSSIDSDIKATNIRKGVDILGVTGTMEEYVAPSLQSKTVSPSTSSQTVKPDSGYDGLSQVTVNAMTTATQATPSITVSSSGLITASATQTAGYVSAGTKSATKQLTTKAATTYTPTTSDQTIASGTYLTGTQTIKGDSNLIASNIKNGVSIFGITGTLEETVDVQVTTTRNDSGSNYYIYCYVTVNNGKSVFNKIEDRNLNTTLSLLKGSCLYVFANSIYNSGYKTSISCTGDMEVIEYQDGFTSKVCLINGPGSIAVSHVEIGAGPGGGEPGGW